MKREDFEIYAIDYLKGNLNPTQHEAFESMLVEEGLSTELDSLRNFIATSSSWANEEPPTRMREEFFESLSKLEQQEKRTKRSILERLDSFIGTVSQYRNIKRLAYSLVLVLIGGFLGYTLNESNKGEKVYKLTEQINEMQANIAKIQLRSYSAADRMKGIGYASKHTSHSDRLMEELFFSLMNDESVHIRIATAQAIHKFQDQPEVRLALEKALINEKDNLAKMNLISLVETFNPELARKEKKKLLDGRLNPKLREILEQTQS